MEEIKFVEHKINLAPLTNTALLKGTTNMRKLTV
jgi:hypothetical protein